MIEQSHIPLELAYDLSMQALEAARQEQWDRVQVLTTLRDAQLKLGHPHDGRSADLVRLLIEHNAQLLTLAEHARSAVHQEMAQQKYSHRALSMYVGVGADG